MPSQAATRTARYTAFVGLAILVQSLVYRFNAGGLGVAHRQDLIRTALFFDCVLTIPFCYWLLLVRPGLRGKASLALIAGVSGLRGAYLLPSRYGMAIGGVAELALVVIVATRIKRIEDLLPSKTLARIVRAELDVYRYALGRNRKLVLPAGARAFTIHEATGAASLFWLLALLTPIEAAIMHWMLPAKLAWIFTALSVYGALWMIAVARSFTALPIVVDAQGVTLRRGMLASLHVPREAIASVARVGDGRDFARFAVLAEPTVWITFHRPIEVELPLGFTREVRGAAVAPDDPAGFFAALTAS